MKADLHTHTIHSDGMLSSQKLINLAKSKGIDVLAVTDHDTLEGVYSALEHHDQDIKIVPGIELSTSYHGESVHVLGYFHTCPPRISPLQDFMNEQKERRDRRAIEIIQRLKVHFDIHIDASQLVNEHSKIITRAHIAKEIQKVKPNLSHDKIFKHILSNHSKAYIPSTKISTLEGIELLKKSGALVVIAHPGIYKKLDMTSLFELPIDGVEVYYKSHKTSYRQTLLKLVQSHGMIATGGSDYHGDITINHANLGDEGIVDDDVNTFLKRLTSLT